MIRVLDWVFTLGMAYAAAGVLAAIALHAVGLRRIDPAVRGAGVAFRILTTPGIVALWPWLVVRWMRAGATGAPQPQSGPDAAALRSTHRGLAFVLAVAVPIALAVALATRPVALFEADLPVAPAATVEE